MKYCLLTEAPESAFHLLYYSQTRCIKFSDVICVGYGDTQVSLLKSYASINSFSLTLVDNPNSEICLDVLRKVSPDVLVIMLSTIVKEPLLEIPRVATVNTHAGILPRYRGVDSRRWAILEGGEVGVTCHIVDLGVDTGPILAQRVLTLQPGDTIQSLSERNYYTNKWQTLIDGLYVLEKSGIAPTHQSLSTGHQYFWMHPRMASLVDEVLVKKWSKLA